MNVYVFNILLEDIVSALTEKYCTVTFKPCTTVSIYMCDHSYFFQEYW